MDSLSRGWPSGRSGVCSWAPIERHRGAWTCLGCCARSRFFGRSSRRLRTIIKSRRRRAGWPAGNSGVWGSRRSCRTLGVETPASWCVLRVLRGCVVLGCHPTSCGCKNKSALQWSFGALLFLHLTSSLKAAVFFFFCDLVLLVVALTLSYVSRKASLRKCTFFQAHV